MADNYLERKMEEYRKGKTAGGKFSRRPSQGYFALKMAGLKVLFIGQVTVVADRCLRRLASSGCKVAFSDSGRGTSYAQQSGAMYIPCASAEESLEIAIPHLSVPDAVILTEAVDDAFIAGVRRDGVGRVIGLGSELPERICDVRIICSECDAEAAANLCAVLTHPSACGVGDFNLDSRRRAD